MNCCPTEGSLVLLAHAELRGLELWRVRRHLCRCPECHTAWRRCLVERDALYRATSPLPLPSANMPTLADEVIGRIRQFNLAHAAAPRRAPRLALVLAALLIAAALSATAASLWSDGRLRPSLKPPAASPAATAGLFDCGLSPDGILPPGATPLPGQPPAARQ